MSVCPTAKGKYYEAQCIDVDPVKKVVKCQYSKPFKCVSMDFPERIVDL